MADKLTTSPLIENTNLFYLYSATLHTSSVMQVIPSLALTSCTASLLQYHHMTAKLYISIIFNELSLQISYEPIMALPFSSSFNILIVTNLFNTAINLTRFMLITSHQLNL